MAGEPQKTSKVESVFISLLIWIGITAVFILMVGGFRVQYKGNQASKFLYGFAQGGRGYLEEDWVANTQDPLPVFSFLVKGTYQYLNENFFYVFQFVLIGIYLYSVVGIVSHIYQLKRTKLLFFIFISIYLLSYSTFWPGTLPTTLHYGVAGQDFGFYAFLPNAFLALMFLSVNLFLKKKLYWAIVSMAVGCYFHSGYLIIGAVLVSAYLVLLYFENKDLKQILRLGLISLGLVLPVVGYSYLLNQHSTAEQVNQATAFMVNQLIPQHTLVTYWWNEFAFYKLLLILVAMLVSRRTKLFPILSISLLIIAAPTILLFITPSNKIAFLQIWRVSTVAVPLASAILIAAGVSQLYKFEEVSIRRWRILIYFAFSIMLLVTGYHGVQAQIENIQQSHMRSEIEMMDFVHQTAASGQTYLIPPDEGLLVSFRVHTGVPILINNSSHVYNAVEVLEWERRYQYAEKFYQSEGPMRCSTLSEINAVFGITHVVTYVNPEFSCEGYQKIFENDRYFIFQYSP